MRVGKYLSSCSTKVMTRANFSVTFERSKVTMPKASLRGNPPAKDLLRWAHLNTLRCKNKGPHRYFFVNEIRPVSFYTHRMRVEMCRHHLRKSEAGLMDSLNK